MHTPFSLSKLTAVSIHVFRGSSVYNALLAFLGVQIKGCAIVMDQALYEYQNVKIEDKTIIDSSHISGHHVVFDQVTLGHSSVRGILNQGTYCPCANIVGSQTEPWREYIGTQATRSSGNTNTSKGSVIIIRENSFSSDGEDKRLCNSSDIESPIIAKCYDDSFEVNPVSYGRTNTGNQDDCISYSDCNSYSSSDISC